MSDRSKKQNQETEENQSSQDALLESQAEIDELRAKVQAAQENERRARADYQNLLRRNQEERAALVKLANKSLVADMLQPLEHLGLAAQQINDQGLNMVLSQLWRTLEEQGLKEIDPQGKKFDWKTMEVVDKTTPDVDEEAATVAKVIRKGFELNGEVIQHAKVIVGKEK